MLLNVKMCSPSFADNVPPAVVKQMMQTIQRTSNALVETSLARFPITRKFPWQYFCQVWNVTLHLQESSLCLKAHRTALHSEASGVGPDVPSGWDLTGSVHHSRFTWPPMRNWSDNHSRVNHFHKLIALEKMNRAESLRHLCGVGARFAAGEQHCSSIDRLRNLLSVWRCVWKNLSLHMSYLKSTNTMHSEQFHIHTMCFKTQKFNRHNQI